VRLAVAARRRPVVTGLRSMIGANGEMLEDTTDSGWASIDGVVWRVRVETPLAKGRRIRVIGMKGNVPIVAQGDGAS
jgi:membrane-bound serine protease (ClpP class)